MSAPDGWLIWQGKRRGEEISRVLEYPLFSDSRWLAEVRSGIGPFRVLNTIGGPFTPGPHYGQAFVMLALQVGLTGDQMAGKLATKTDPASYHGGWIDEEMAALISLAMNARCRSGGLWRDFGLYEEDEKGQPLTAHFSAPNLIAPKGPGWRMLPHLNLEVDLDSLPPFLNAYAALGPQTATALVRAARLFQQALWIADADPNLSWVLLVSALEAAVDSWKGHAKQEPLHQIKENWQELGDLLAEVQTNDAGLAGKLAKLLRGNVRVQSRVKRFVASFAPNPPSPRPKFDAVDWDPESLAKYIGKIYNWRSRFLHSALPFPGAMCDPPRADGDGGFSECPGGLGTGIGRATWLAEDTPMMLWTFAYLVGEVLRAWWLEESPSTIAQ
ncbi:MAG TPA: hypothetical protein VIT89_07415 [Solirubrobacterales bacterium]